MGKGDVKTKKGKIANGSYGNKRSRENNKSVEVNTANTAAVATVKK